MVRDQVERYRRFGGTQRLTLRNIPLGTQLSFQYHVALANGVICRGIFSSCSQIVGVIRCHSFRNVTSVIFSILYKVIIR
jgi:hypothetical protein